MLRRQANSSKIFTNSSDNSSGAGNSSGGIAENGNGCDSGSGGVKRVLTPFNQLIGPMMITQWRRSSVVTCSRIQDNALGANFQGTCMGDALDARPFGVDPAFLPNSSIYDGTLNVANYYTENELAASQGDLPPLPFGFFPVRWANASRTGLVIVARFTFRITAATKYS